MALNKTQPILDLLTVNNFLFEIERLPAVKFMVQSVTLPDLSLAEVQRATPFQTVREVSEHCDFGSASVEFLVDEELQNYLTLFYWMNGLGFPNEYGEFADFANGVYDKHGIKDVSFASNSGAFQFSDIALTIISNHKNPVLEFKFLDAFPTSLGSISMNVTNSDADPITCSATFQFTGMQVRALK